MNTRKIKEQLEMMDKRLADAEEYIAETQILKVHLSSILKIGTAKVGIRFG